MHQIKFVGLALAFTLLLICVPQIQNVIAKSTIYIREDGTVEGTDKIQRNGTVYTFTDNLYNLLVVEKDNITIDGVGYSITGENTDSLQFLDGIGIRIKDRSDVSLQNVCIQNFLYGIYINRSFNTRINKCNITKNTKGICIEGSFHNNIRESQITENYDGLSVFKSGDTTIGRALICNNVNHGVIFDYSYDEDIDSIWYSTISENGVGVRIVNSSVNHIIDQNSITKNSVGVYLQTSLIVFQFNNISYNDVGIQVNGSDNRITHNNFIDNTKQVYDVARDNPESSPSINRWYSGDTGNYWSDYTGTGETPYIIDKNNQDNCPTTKPFQIPTEPWDTELDYILPAIEGAAFLLVFMVAIVVVAFVFVKKRRKQKFEG